MTQIGGRTQLIILMVIICQGLSYVQGGETYNPNKQDVNIKLYYFNKQYYLVHKNAKLSWINAEDECTKYNMDLFEKQDNNKDYEKLLKYLKDQNENLHDEPYNFWTAEKKIKGTFFSGLGLGFVDVNCTTISSLDYKFEMVPCDQPASFICQGKAINIDEMRTEAMRLRIVDDEYYIEPKEMFAFMPAYRECTKRQMSLATWKDFLNNDLIMKYTRNISFWTYTPNSPIPPKTCNMIEDNMSLDCDTKRAFVCKQLQKFSVSFYDQLVLSNPFTIAFAILGVLILLITTIVCIRICSVRRRRSYNYNLDNRIIIQ